MLLSSQSILPAKAPPRRGWGRGRLTCGGSGAMRGFGG
jgi:hypothetical protein